MQLIQSRRLRFTDTRMFDNIMMFLAVMATLALGWFAGSYYSVNNHAIHNVPIVTIEADGPQYESVSISADLPTLSHIAVKFYPGENPEAVVRRIREANPHLPADNRLRIGMEVRLP